MNIVEARLKTAQAIAKANGDSNAEANFAALITDLQAVKHDPYILPDVLTPPAEAAPTVQEVHDAVQAGETTPEEAHADGLIPSPDVIPPADNPVTPPADTSAPVSAEGPVAVADSIAPVTESPSAPAVDAPAPVDPAAGDAPAQPEPVVPPADPAPAVAQGDAGDEDPTPADKETIDSLDARVDALEGHPRKVSRQ